MGSSPSKSFLSFIPPTKPVVPFEGAPRPPPSGQPSGADGPIGPRRGRQACRVMTRDYDNRSQMPSSASALHSPSPYPSFVFPSTPRIPHSSLSLSLSLCFHHLLHLHRRLLLPLMPPSPHPSFRLLDVLEPSLWSQTRISLEILLEHAHYTPILFIRYGCRVYTPPIAFIPAVSTPKPLSSC